MLNVTVRFPLGVYHGQSAQSAEEPEWPPSSLRLIGALLAAVHERPDADPPADRILLGRLCEEPAPLILAPDAVSVEEQVDGDQAVRLRGATRWAPLNHVKGAIFPRNLGRERAAVSKVGVAIGKRPVHFVWPELEMTPEELGRLEILASEVTFLGTTRSPALVEAGTCAPTAMTPSWTPVGEGLLTGDTVAVRVPDSATIAAFDRRHAARHSRNGGVQPGGMVPQTWIGRTRTYAFMAGDAPPPIVDPRRWGEAIVLALDEAHGGEHGGLRIKAPAAYLLARAVRVALLGAFGPQGDPEEAPSILTARGADPHCAIVPLPHIWGEHADGRILGVAFVLPHASRVPDLMAQRTRLERGIRALVEGERRFVQIPRAGRVWLELPSPERARLATLRVARYARPAQSWVSVTPVVHSRWRKGGEDALLRQLAADCLHVGLPEPVDVQLLRGPGRRGGAYRTVSRASVPEAWRASISGQTDHVRLTFAAPVRGPLLLGRSRHFGGGLCVPDVNEEMA